MAIAGKSTVTAMLGVALRSLGEDITAIVGAQVPQVWVNDEPNKLFTVLYVLLVLWKMSEKFSMQAIFLGHFGHHHIHFLD